MPEPKPLAGQDGATVQAFIDAVEDLRSRTRLTASAYDCIQASGLLRRLLIDGNALGPSAAKILGEAPTFSWQPVWRKGPDWWVLDPLFDPTLTNHITKYVKGIMEPGKSLEGHRDKSHEELLATDAFLYGQDEAQERRSLRELVKQIAVDEGGVHVGMYRDRDAKIQAALGENRLRVLRSMIGIGRVVVRGYEPMILMHLTTGEWAHRTSQE
ncbi:hypothetical protein Slu03_22860 [Sediminihabitans luteus]|nr:hypothetical protein Slu03_22860 [Sediminihabitans luteus]